MRSTNRLVGMVVATALMGACDVPENNVPQADELEAEDVRGLIEEQNQRWEQAFGQGDGAAVAELYTDDGRLMASGAPTMQGHEAIADFMRGASEMGAESVELTTEDVELAGDKAIEVGSYEMRFSGGPGQPGMTDRGKYVVVWELQDDDSWLMDIDIFNSNQQPPAPGETGASDTTASDTTAADTTAADTSADAQDD